jgi:3-dehydroquinate synthetase
VPGGEKIKTLGFGSRLVERIVGRLASAGSPRPVLVAVGGGTVGDLVGFIASVLARGVPWIHIPTTWLAAVDSAHGGKTALNVAGFKNQVGSFYPPNRVCVIKAALLTHPASQARMSWSEALKVAVLSDRRLFTKTLRAAADPRRRGWNLLRELIAAKLRFVEADFQELTGERQALNLGHTLGHAFEVLWGWPHGAAVAEGMKFALRWSERRRPELAATLRPLHLELARLTAPLRVRALVWSSIQRTIARDKKMRSDGRLQFVFLADIGRPERRDVSFEDIRAELLRQGYLG